MTKDHAEAVYHELGAYIQQYRKAKAYAAQALAGVAMAKATDNKEQAGASQEAHIDANKVIKALDGLLRTKFGRNPEKCEELLRNLEVRLELLQNQEREAAMVAAKIDVALRSGVFEPDSDERRAAAEHLNQVQLERDQLVEALVALVPKPSVLVLHD